MSEVEKTLPDFKVFFNKKRQWLDVYLWDVHPTTFSSWKMGRWGCFNESWENTKSGLFGDLHMVKSRVREDLVAHEMFHVLVEWMWANRTYITSRNEESMAEILDELVRNFYREYRKVS